MRPEAFKALIFDLDDTLLDTSGQLIGPAAQDACQAMVKEGLDCTVEACVRRRAELVRRGVNQPLEVIGREFGSRDDDSLDRIVQAGLRAFYEREVPANIKLFPGAFETLLQLKQHHLLFLVTIGSVPTQSRKLEILGIAPQFQKVFVVDISVDSDKTGALRKILMTTRLNPEQVLCIGNRIDSEIVQAKRLGMKTCWVRQGEHAFAQPRLKEETPDFTIRALRELVSLCKI